MQVPCYVFDTDGKKHDLSPLIQVSDGFLVDDSNDSIDFYINICRSLSESRSKRDRMNNGFREVQFRLMRIFLQIF